MRLAGTRMYAACAARIRHLHSALHYQKRAPAPSTGTTTQPSTRHPAPCLYHAAHSQDAALAPSLHSQLTGPAPAPAVSTTRTASAQHRRRVSTTRPQPAPAPGTGTQHQHPVSTTRTASSEHPAPATQPAPAPCTGTQHRHPARSQLIVV